MREQGLGDHNDSGIVLTVAGVLLATDDPSAILGGKDYVECFRYRDDGPVEDLRTTIRGPLQVQIRHTVAWIQQQLGRDIVLSGLDRVELDRLPEKALREAIATLWHTGPTKTNGEPCGWWCAQTTSALPHRVRYQCP